MTRRLAIRRFPDSITRKRELPGAFNAYGEFEPGLVRETIFRANVQPLSVEDIDTVAGSQFSERLKVFVPTGEGGSIVMLDRFVWGNDELRWGNDRFLGQSRTAVNEAGEILRAAAEDTPADRVEFRGRDYVVEESRSWLTHTRATLLRQT